MNHWQTNYYPEHQNRLSLSPSPLLAGIRLLESRGIDIRELEQRWGYPLASLHHPYLRIPAFLARRFWDAACSLDADPALGLAAARPADLGQLLGLNYLMQLMPSRIEALRTMQRFWPLVASHVNFDLKQQANELHITARQSSPLRPAQEEIDYWFARQVHHLRSWVCAPNPILEVHMRRPRPTDPTPWEQLTNCPVHFSAKLDEMVLDVSALECERPAGPASVRRALEEALEDYAQQTREGRPLELISSSILQHLHHGVSLDIQAERLHMTTRTLHRTLLLDGWSFSELIDIHRRYLAHDLLMDGELAIAEIADQLGYGEVSSFTRAIRRWYDMTPSELRDKPQRNS